MKYIIVLIVIFIFFSCTRSTENENVAIDSQTVSKDLHDLYDSLMYTNINLPILIDSSNISVECIQQFEELARSTQGELSVVIDPAQLSSKIAEIIENNLSDNSDLLLIIDRTHSMKYDMLALKNGLEKFIIQMQDYKNLNIGIATYGDKQNKTFPWYEFVNFGDDFEAARTFIQNIEVHSGLGIPESVYDAILETSHEGFWNSKGERIAILLGDAPSHDSTKSSKSIKDVLNYANKNGVRMNIYPVVLGPNPIAITNKNGPVMQSKNFINSVYPNPTSGLISINLINSEALTLEVFDSEGNKILTKQLTESQNRIDITNGKIGPYIVRVYDKNKNYDFRRVIKTN